MLRESEKKYRNLVETVRDVIWGVTADGMLAALNRAFEVVTGWSCNDWLGKHFGPLIHPEDLPIAMETIQRCLAGETPPVIDMRVRTKDGRYLLFEFTAAPQWENGSVVGIMGIARDLTERRQVEERLRLQSAALEAAANSIVITDREGMIEWANPAFTVLTGYPFAEVVGRNLRELVKSGEHDQVFYKDLWNTILAGKVWNGQITNRRKDGSLYTEEMTITPLHNERREINRFIAIKQDITARRQAEEKLREEKNRAQKYLDVAGVMFLVLNVDQTVRHINKKGCEILGYKEEEIIGKHWSDHFIPERYRESVTV